MSQSCDLPVIRHELCDMKKTSDSLDITAPTRQRLSRWWAVAGLMLLASTWRLWIPQTEFPQVPVFRWSGTIPAWLEWSYLFLLVVALVRIALRREDKVEWLVAAGSLFLLTLIDQHRLQPWAYQIWLMSFVFASPKAATTDDEDEGPLRRLWLRLDSIALLKSLTISIYFWSAISKCDRAFVATHGQTLVQALGSALRVEVADWPVAVRWWFAAAIPVAELLVALGLCWNRTQRPALLGAISLHGILLIALGPFGLNHSPGVLLWNLAFAGHDWLLFGHERSPLHVAQPECSFFKVVRGLIVCACLWPLAEPFGGCDHWLAWSVYSTRTERVSVTLSEEGVKRLPPDVRRLVANGELPLDHWSLDVLGVPVYPQERFQLGLVEWLRLRCGDDNIVEATVIRPASRATGEVVAQRFSAEQLDERLDSFWLNARP